MFVWKNHDNTEEGDWGNRLDAWFNFSFFEYYIWWVDIFIAKYTKFINKNVMYGKINHKYYVNKIVI